MDNLDKEIISILQQDAKITNAQLSKDIGLSPSSTLERVRRLESIGIIKGYQVILDREKIGLKCSFFLYVKLKLPLREYISGFEEIIKEIPEITETYRICGKYDYLLKIICSNIADYEYLISEVISDSTEIQEMKTEVVLNTIKEGQGLPIKVNEDYVYN